MKLTPLPVQTTAAGNNSIIYPTLIEANNKLYLVDCGYDETVEELVTALTAVGVAVKDLHAIIITHDDIDHLGGLYHFKSLNPHLIVYCCEVEESSVSGKTKAERLLQAEASLPLMPAEHKAWAEGFITQLTNIKRLAVDKMLRDGDEIEPGLIIVHTPGHTKGHISLYIPRHATVIAGDAVVVEGDVLNIANPSFTLDMPTAVQSVERIRNLKPATLICYHGGVIEDDLESKLSAVIEKYKAW